MTISVAIVGLAVSFMAGLLVGLSKTLMDGGR
jgi:hypothetical protein